MPWRAKHSTASKSTASHEARLGREAALVLHVVLGNAHGHGHGHDHLWVQAQGHLSRHPSRRGDIVFKGQVFEVLFDAAGGDDSGLEFPGLKPLAKFAPGVIL